MDKIIRLLLPEEALTVVRRLCAREWNSEDFLTPDVEADLSAYDCIVIPSFTHGLRFINGRLESS